MSELKITVALDATTLSAITSAVASFAGQTAPAAQTRKAAPMEVVGKEEVTTETAPTANTAPAGRRRGAAPVAEEAATAEVANTAPAGRGRRGAAPAAAPAPVKAEPVEVNFDELSDEDKLAEIQGIVSKHTKKGKTSSIKLLLEAFGTNKASLLTPDDYGDFYNALLDFNAIAKEADRTDDAMQEIINSLPPVE